MFSSYLVDIIFLLIAAVIVVPFSQAIKLGTVPGFLIAGVLVGPYGLGLINNIREIRNLAEIGVVFLLFVIGIELKPLRLWQMRRLVFGLGTLQVLFTGLLIGGLGNIFWDIPLRAAILVGPALALSSTAFVLQLLSEKKLLNSTYGRTSFAILLLQDLAVVPLLALVPLLAVPELSVSENIGLALVESLLIVGLIIFLGRFFLHPVLHRIALSGSPEIFTASAVLVVLGTALLTEHAGLSMAMGAFLAGLLISSSFYSYQIKAEIQPFRGLLLGLFFMSMGMSLNLNLLKEKPIISFGLLILLLLVKIAVLCPIVYLFRINAKNSLAVALILSQSGEFALVLFSLAQQSKLLTQELFQQLLLVVLLSMLTTPLLAMWAQLIIKSQKAKKEKSSPVPAEATIVIAGFGRVGHRIGEILSRANKPFIGLDFDAEIVKNERKKGHPVFYGDVRQPELLKSAGADNAKMIIVTINDPKATEEIVLLLRKTYPKINIYARGRSLSQCCDLLRLGVTDVVSENIEASLELARMSLAAVGVDEKELRTLLEDFRRTYHAQIEEVCAIEKTKKIKKP